MEGSPTLRPRACIPWTRPTPPVRATACGSVSVFADGSTERARYDADSRPLEVRRFKSDGTLDSVETRNWSGGLQRLFRREEQGGDWFMQSEWTYEGRRLLRRVDSRWYGGPITYDYVYDAQGRLERVVRQEPEDTVTSLYTYDPRGRLVRIADAPGEGSLCGLDDSRCATLSYWPNGKLQRHVWESGMMNFEEAFDEAGRLVASLEQDRDRQWLRELGYDAAGRVSREWRRFTVHDWVTTSVRRTVHDEAGWRERFVEELADYVCGIRRPGCEPERSSVHVTRRATFFCGTQIVALDEWDGDRDGAVDATRTHERDDAGRLVHEEYSGTPGLDDGPVRRDFTYTCE